MINAGELRNRITIQRRPDPPVTSRASDGSENYDWTDVVTVWSSFKAGSGREFYAVQKLNSEVNAIFKMWYREGLDTTMRVKYGNRYFDILFINDSGKYEGELTLACREVV
jgi:SPP1 family predicted phage head-tail adaptor